MDFQWEAGQCKGVCPECNRPVTFKIVDKFTSDEMGRRVKFMCYSARDMHLKYN